MSYTILHVAYPFAPVRSDTPGGAEQIILTLASGAAKTGHQPIIAACSGSSCDSPVIETALPESRIDQTVRTEVWKRHQQSIEQALRDWRVDIIHMHGIDFHAYLPAPGVPVVVTLHLPVSWYPPAALMAGRPETFFTCVSRSQQSTCPDVSTLLPFVENGVPVQDLADPSSRTRRADFALSLGRICPEKGFHLALGAARRAGIGLIIAGAVFRYEAHERYFAQDLAPRLDGKEYRFIGPVGFRKKREMLSAARCLLVPSLAPETSSLVAMEAMACGTPVIAFPSGALADIVEDGTTGFLVHDQAEMAEAIHQTSRIDPEACRSAALRRFSAERMVRGYCDIYKSIIEHTTSCASR
jgi:glycosyltransferase involved in cell wall biosynthesis